VVWDFRISVTLVFSFGESWRYAFAAMTTCPAPLQALIGVRESATPGARAEKQSSSSFRWLALNPPSAGMASGKPCRKFFKPTCSKILFKGLWKR